MTRFISRFTLQDITIVNIQFSTNMKCALKYPLNEKKGGIPNINTCSYILT